MAKQRDVSPAMAAGITDRLWSLEDVVAKIDELAAPPKKRGPYHVFAGQKHRMGLFIRTIGDRS